MIVFRVGYCCVVGALSFATPCGIVRELTFQIAKSSLVRPTIVSSVRTQWIFPVQVRFVFSNRVYCTCAPFPALIMFYLSIIFIDFDDYDTDSLVSPLFPILTALRTTKRTLGRLESISISSALPLSQFFCICLYIPTDLCSFARTS